MVGEITLQIVLSHPDRPAETVDREPAGLDVAVQVAHAALQPLADVLQAHLEQSAAVRSGAAIDFLRFFRHEFAADAEM